MNSGINCNFERLQVMKEGNDMPSIKAYAILMRRGLQGLTSHTKAANTQGSRLASLSVFATAAATSQELMDVSRLMPRYSGTPAILMSEMYRVFSACAPTKKVDDMLMRPDSQSTIWERMRRRHMCICLSMLQPIRKMCNVWPTLAVCPCSMS